MTQAERDLPRQGPAPRGYHHRRQAVRDRHAIGPGMVSPWPDPQRDRHAGKHAGRGSPQGGIAEAGSARMKIYLSGPMKGYPQSNYPTFRAAAADLRGRGYEVYDPSEFPHDGPQETFPIRKAFAAYAKFICEEADAIVLLPGWEKSVGVSAELALAKNCGLTVIEWPCGGEIATEGRE